MKKSIAVLLALVLMMTVVFFGCGKKDEDEAEGKTDETSQQESTSVADSNNDIVFKPGIDVTEETTAPYEPSTEETTDSVTVTEDANVTTTQNNTVIPSTVPQGDTQTGTQTQTGKRIEKYRKIFATGTYAMTVIMVEDGIEDMPMEMAVKNGNICINMDMDGMTATMLYTAQNDTMYMLIDFMKIYSDVTEEMMGEELDFSQFTKEFDIDVTGPVTETKTQFDGNNVICESYVKDGNTIKYYFDENDVMIASEKTEKDGSVSVMKISDFSSTVDDSVFEIPSDYKYMNLAWLMQMA